VPSFSGLSSSRHFHSLILSPPTFQKVYVSRGHLCQLLTPHDRLVDIPETVKSNDQGFLDERRGHFALFTARGESHVLKGHSFSCALSAA
jgi:hypothetical protein